MKTHIFMVIQADKQFYLDQAKQLKDIFNSKYPDYVYRRRPNNSRRRRGTGPGGSRALDSLANEAGGDESGHTEFDDISPVDEDLLVDISSTDFRHTRISADITSAYDMNLRASSYNHTPSDTSYRPSHGRSPYPPSGQQRGTPDISIEPPHLAQSMAATHHYQQSYLQAHQSQPQSSHLYASEHGTWDPVGVPRGEHARTTPAGWLGSQDRLLANHTPDRSPPGNSQSSWARTTSPAPTRSTGASSPSVPFTTLNSPFYPSQISGNYSGAASPTSSLPSSATAYHHSSSDHVQDNSQIRRPSSAYGHRSYASSPPSNHYVSTPNRGLHMYQQHQSQQLLSVQSRSIPHIHTSSSTGSGSGTPGF